MKKKYPAESALQIYLKEISKFPLLSIEEERKITRKVAGNDQRAREKLIRSNLRLVVNIAREYVNRGLSFLDLIEEGNIGLIHAVKKFNPSMGYKFSTYATWWIKQAIRRAIRNKAKTVRIPSYIVENVSKLKTVTTDLLNKFERPPSVDEIAKQMDITAKKVQSIEDAIRSIVSLDASDVTSSDIIWALANIIPDKRTLTPEDELEEIFERESVAHLLDIINKREAMVLKMRYGLSDGKPKTLDEIGKKLRLSRERVRQIEKATIQKLHYILTKE
jgi:RNA polymerase primary sigma factor